MTIIMPYLTSENYTLYQFNGYKHENHEKLLQIVNKIISSYIDETTLLKIKQHTTLSLYDLLIPVENNRTCKVPRPQNSFVIYRRNLQAKMALTQSSSTTDDKLVKLSKVAGKKWKNETKEIRELYAFIADCAKKVHGKIFPGYVYHPRRCPTIKFPMTSPLPNDNDLSPSSNNNLSPHINLLSTLEITPNFMNSYDDKICKILNHQFF